MTDVPLSAAATIGEARAALHRRLGDGLETDHLLCRVLNCERPHLYAHPEATFEPSFRRCLETLLLKRLGGTPLAYLTGVREFFSLPFEVAPETLIPRPETETLVGVALAAAPTHARILDLGTGCGAIAIAIAHTRPDTTVWACDNSRGALAIAQRNAKRHSVRNVSFFESDWFDQLPAARFDVIVGNPPYVAADDPDLDSTVAAHEPNAAVFAADNGLACLNRVIADTPARLGDRGVMAIEHGYTQAETVARLMETAGFGDVHCTPDLNGHPRVTAGVKKQDSHEKINC